GPGWWAEGRRGRVWALQMQRSSFRVRSEREEIYRRREAEVVRRKLLPGVPHSFLQSTKRPRNFAKFREYRAAKSWRHRGNA
ncbi:unnamed protein product, partial [Ectocarpus sp. 12 AP-2014]